jgi:hypothetical protein
MKGSEFPHNMENFRRAKFNEPFNNQTIMKKDLFLFVLALSHFPYGS